MTRPASPASPTRPDDAVTTPAAAPARARVVLADRGDPLVGPMSVAMARRFDVVGQLDTELSAQERMLVAASTFHPDRRLWAERFWKSNLAVGLRSRRARTRLTEVDARADVIFQTHALFELTDRRTVMYIDCTHRQSMEQWPDWNPLSGRALSRWLLRERRQYQDSAHVFAFSEETARSVVEQYDVPQDRVSVVGAGVNFAALPTPAPRGDGPPTVLFVGNDFERKGGPRLLEAFAGLRRAVPSARLRIAGTAHGLRPQPGVEVLGRVAGRDQMSRLYSEADVFCLPSLYDPFPGALLEAMAHGLPAVVTGTCGVPEIIDGERTALTVGRGDTMAAELTAALEALLSDPATATRMGARGRARVEERFTWSHVVDRMAPAIERISRTGAEAA